ncbi:MAG TPA: SgcJ/EcaC family oxidoreductase [Pyrinomonadaceae bacterium]|nr:SgcJ/EcaC family oxidoreductase [Pyrinomonadaceae bacterium]
MQSQSSAVADVKKSDKQAIRRLVDTWLEASKKGDVASLNSLMADDVIFITPGREPFGKEEFSSNSEQMKNITMETDIDIKEIEVAGAWAWMRSFLKLTMTPAAGNPTKLSGHILTVLRKNPDGRWVIARDANFVTPEK